MPNLQISTLAHRVACSDPRDIDEQKAILESLGEILKTIDRSTHRDACEFLDGAALLMTFMVHLGHLGGESVVGVVASLLDMAHHQMLLSPVQIRPAGKLAGDSANRNEWAALDVVSDAHLGEILRRKEFITSEDIANALHYKKSTGLLFGEALLKIGAATWAQVEEGLTEQDAFRRMAAKFAPADEPEADEDETPKQLELKAQAGSHEGLKLMSDVLLGEVLIRYRLINKDQLSRALQSQRISGMRIGEALVDLGFCTWDNVKYAVELQGQMRRYAS